EERLLRLAASAERGSEHPLAEAIVRGARERGLTLADAADFQALAGHGVEATIEGVPVLLGNRRLLRDRGIGFEQADAQATELASQGKSAIFAAVDGRCAGVIAVADQVKPESKPAIAQMHAMGLEVAMLTGDNRQTAEAVAR